MLMSYMRIQPYDRETDGPVLGCIQPPAHPPLASWGPRDSNLVADAPQPPGVVWPNSLGFGRGLFIQTALDVFRVGAALLLLGATGFAIGASVSLLFF